MTQDPMEKVRPELRQTAAEARNAYARFRVSQGEARRHIAEVRRLTMRLRSQGVSTWTLARLLDVSQTQVCKLTKPLKGGGRQGS